MKAIDHIHQIVCHHFAENWDRRIRCNSDSWGSGYCRGAFSESWLTIRLFLYGATPKQRRQIGSAIRAGFKAIRNRRAQVQLKAA